MTKFIYNFTGEIQPSMNLQQESYQVEYDDEGQPCHPYDGSPELYQAVKLAIDLEMPLLLEGAPGSGKTELARALRYELTYRNFSQAPEQKPSRWWPYFRWDVKSTTQIIDELYEYDSIGRVRDAQLVGANPKELISYLGKEQSEKLKLRLLDPNSYYKDRTIGKAFAVQDCRPIILVDEVDKAGRDFPNDLLSLIDKAEFSILEFEKAPVKAHQPPILIFTSNREKPLPDPFLRRCVYFHVGMPSQEKLSQIVKQRHEFPEHYQAVVDDAAACFMEMVEAQSTGQRAPGLSEFLDFMRALLALPVLEAKEVLENLFQEKYRSYLGLLIKSKPQQDRYQGQNS